MTEAGFQKVIDQFGAQLGELAWHHFNVDASVDEVSSAHAQRIVSEMKQFLPVEPSRPIRFLELGAYCHYTAYQLAHTLGAAAVVSDISPNALREGAKLAVLRGFPASVPMVAADFHDLPFVDDYFDVVFIASAIHHTWRTSQILHEMLRIVRPGGLFIIENEPIGRDFCFYQFRSSRLESMTPFEAGLQQADLMRTVSSPFIGSRPEELFGMIENDRIPMAVYEHFMAQCDVMHLLITPANDSWGVNLLRMGRDPRKIAAALEREMVRHREALTDIDRLMGFSLPTKDEILTLCETASPQVRALQSGKYLDERSLELARLLGGTLQTTLRKRGSPVKVHTESIFRREPPCVDGVYVDRPTLAGVAVALDDVLLPEFGEASRDELAHYFPEAQWTLYREEQGSFSMTNRCASLSIELPQMHSQGVLLLRFYCAARPGNPYFLDISSADGTLESHAICVSESRLSKIHVPHDARRVQLLMREHSGAPVDLPAHLRLGVCRIVPFREAA